MSDDDSQYQANAKAESGNPAAPVLDKAGQGLETVLSPVGAVVGTITKPVTGALGSITHPALAPVAGTRDEKMEVIGGKNVDSYQHGKDSLGGKAQTGDNPLGLDQTGKWGFREEGVPADYKEGGKFFDDKK